MLTPTTKTPSGKRQAPRKPSRQRKPARFLRWLIPLLLLVVVAGALVNLGSRGWFSKLEQVPSWVDVQIIDINGSGRRGEQLEGVRDIVIHYVGNPGTTAQQNHDFFNQPETSVSAHFLVGLDGEVIQCIPLNEKSSASNERNLDTISIEVCHPDASGQFNQATYDSLVKLTAWLCDAAGIGREHVIRHYDITGKLCPLSFVEHPDTWTQFLEDVKHA